MEITPQMEVGKIAAQYPAATRVFSRHKIDFCCGGGRPLAEVCERGGVDLAIVMDELQQAEQPAAPQRQWTTAPKSTLIQHIIATYHVPLREELPRLVAMSQKVHRVHGEKDPERLRELVSLVTELSAELLAHMAKEENVLFPMIQRGQHPPAPIHVMQREHDEAGAMLVRIRALTDDFAVPEQACTTWRALWDGLEQLENDLHEHIHLENNILFATT